MSRYSGLSTRITEEGKTIHVTSPQIEKEAFLSMPYTVHRIQQGEELDQLAYDAYGDGRLWWIIAMANGLALPTDAYAGQVLVIPTDHKAVLSAIEQANGIASR